MDRFSTLWDFNTEAEGVVNNPARCGDLDYPRIVKSPLLCIEIRIGPNRTKFGSADTVNSCVVFNIHGIADQRQLTILVRVTLVRPGDIVDLLVGLAFGVKPTLDDLDAIEIGTNRIT